MRETSNFLSESDATLFPVLPGISEFAAKPEAFIVHDPFCSGGLDVFVLRKSATRLEEELLFRETPQAHHYARQHKEFVKTIMKCGIDIVYLANIIGDHPSYQITASNPNQVFTRDSLITLPWIPKGYIAARMKPVLRRAEAATMSAAVKRLGLTEIIRIPEGLFLEGGDVVPFSRGGLRTLLLGYGPRTRLETAHFLQQTLIPKYLDEIIAIRLADYRINLDGGLLPLTNEVVVSNQESILESSLLDQSGQHPFNLWEMFEELGMHVINTTREESIFSQSCNCVCLGENKVIYYNLCKRVKALLEDSGIQVICIEGSELVKGRGGPRCMTRPVY